MLKLYRKLLVIGVLLTAAFVVSSSNRVAASPCCDACLATLYSCYAYCAGLPNETAENANCVPECVDAYDACSRACGHGIPICPPM